jgi:ABC-type sugar transport system permease subunit
VGYRFGFSAAISYIFFALIVVIGVAQALVVSRRRNLR